MEEIGIAQIIISREAIVTARRASLESKKMENVFRLQRMLSVLLNYQYREVCSLKKFLSFDFDCFTTLRDIESCNGPNEIYSDSIVTSVCDVSCLTYGCMDYSNFENAKPIKWSPNCQCINDNYRRLSNGTCVLIQDEQCMAEFTPSPGFEKKMFNCKSLTR